MLTLGCGHAIFPEVMWLIIRLHYAIRLLLVHLDHLKGLTSVEADLSSLCCYVAHADCTSASSSQQTQDDRQQSIATALRTPIPYVDDMKPSTRASCTIANELFRRRTQFDRDHTTQFCQTSDQRAFPASFAFEDTPVLSSSQSRILSHDLRQACATKTSSSVKKDRSVIGRPRDLIPNLRTVTGMSNDCFHAIRRARLIKRPTVQRPMPDMWKLGLYPDRKNVSILAAMQQNPGRPEKTTNRTQPDLAQGNHHGEGAESPDAQGGEQEWNASNGLIQETSPASPISLPGTKRGIGASDDEIRYDIPRPIELGTRRVLKFSKADSPTSETTAYESATNSPFCISGTGCITWETTHSADIRSDLKAGVEVTQSEQERQQTPTPARRHWARHQRDLSTGSSLTTTRRPIPLRVRARTDDGLLQLKANTSHDPVEFVGSRNAHRRKMSLNIPINVPTTRAEVHQRQAVGESPHCIHIADVGASRSLTNEERELEYKHRHTFIGTTSLDDFLEELEVSSMHSTTKDSVVKAFISLASNEQIHARQSSTTPDGWELVSRVTPDVSSIDYVAQLQVKLGSITLRQFLNMIHFDARDEVGALRVVAAFSAASHLDTQAGVGTGRKARAFRAWMITQTHDVV